MPKRPTTPMTAYPRVSDNLSKLLTALMAVPLPERRVVVTYLATTYSWNDLLERPAEFGFPPWVADVVDDSGQIPGQSTLQLEASDTSSTA